METPTTAKLLGDYVRTGGQVLNSMFNPKEIAQGMWNAIDSGNPFEMGVAALGFFPMGMIGKAGTVEKALLQAEINGANAIGPVSRLVEGGGLVAHEVAGGHLLERHVGKSADQLLDRLATDPKISGSSSFYNRATAESAIAQSLDANQIQINKWLGGSLRDLKIENTLSENIGVTMSKSSANAIDTPNLRLILRRDPTMSNGYRIQTGFPTR